MNKLLLAAVIAAISSTSAIAQYTPPQITTVDNALAVFPTCYEVLGTSCVPVADLASVDMITAEATAREVGDATNADALANETANRQADDSTLAGGILANADDIASETANRQADVAANTQMISTEVTARQAADSTLDGRVTGNSADIGALQNNINGSRGLAEENGHRLDENSAAIVQNRSVIANNTDRITGLETDVSRLDLSIDSLEEEVAGLGAQGAALSSLPQAYGIGNNMISMGVGHYRGANAAALGYSRRWTEGVVTKFGVAISDGKARNDSFNASVGYEF